MVVLVDEATKEHSGYICVSPLLLTIQSQCLYVMSF